MSFMEKFQAQIERFLVPLASKLNSQRHICAIRDAFILTFPLTMAGSLMVLINSVFLSPDGFVCKMLRLQKLFPNIADYQAIFSPVLKGSTDILAILVTFLIARNLAKQLKSDDLLSGLTAVSVYFIIYPDYVNVEGANHLATQFFGPQGLFVAIIVGLLVGELMAKLSKSKRLEIKMPEQVPPAVARTFKLLIPIIITTLSFTFVNFFIKKIAPGLFNINEMVIFGLPIVLNPIYMIPFILTPLVGEMIGYLSTAVFKIIPPIAFQVPWTTPGPLAPFLGTGGNVLALIMGLVSLAVSVLMYAPFVIAASKAEVKAEEDRRLNESSNDKDTVIV